MQGNNGLWAKIFGKKNFNSVYKITCPTSLFWILPSAETYNASCRVFEWTLVMKKRSQNHFRLYVTSKIPYSFDRRSSLSTLACGVHGRLKTTTGKAIILKNNQDKKYNTKEHLKVNNCYSRRRVLRVECLWRSWVTNKTLEFTFATWENMLNFMGLITLIIANQIKVRI